MFDPHDLLKMSAEALPQPKPGGKFITDFMAGMDPRLQLTRKIAEVKSVGPLGIYGFQNERNDEGDENFFPFFFGYGPSD